MFPVFDPTRELQSPHGQLCALTFICSKGDPHPTDAGFRAMARSRHVAASGYPRRP